MVLSYEAKVVFAGAIGVPMAIFSALVWRLTMWLLNDKRVTKDPIDWFFDRQWNLRPHPLARIAAVWFVGSLLYYVASTLSSQR